MEVTDRPLRKAEHLSQKNNEGWRYDLLSRLELHEPLSDGYALFLALLVKDCDVDVRSEIASIPGRCEVLKSMGGDVKRMKQSKKSVRPTCRERYRRCRARG